MNSLKNISHYAIIVLLALILMWVSSLAPHGESQTPVWLQYRTEKPRNLVPPPVAPAQELGVTAFSMQGSYYVHGVFAADRWLDLSPILNADGKYWGISPVGLAATLASECGLKTGVGGDCDRRGGWPDVSGGGCQVTVQTAAAYGVGDGSATYKNINYVFGWEDNPYNCIGLMAHIMHDYTAVTGVPYPWLNVAWNCGPGWRPVSFYYSPTGECATNFYGDYMGWWRWAWARWAILAPFPPVPHKPVAPKPVFPLREWLRYRTAHHLSPLSPLYKGRIGTIAGAWWHRSLSRKCGGVVHQEVWFGKSRYIEQRYSYCTFYHWPRFKGDPTKVTASPSFSLPAKTQSLKKTFHLFIK